MEELKNEIAVEENIDTEANENAAVTDVQESKNDDSALTSNYTEYELSGLTEQQRRRKEIFDKLTTGLLIFLMASPLLIILYIFLWFALR